MTRSVAVVTNALQYAGPGAVAALSAAGYALVCHDEAFLDETVRRDFEAGQPGACAHPGKAPGAAIAHAVRMHGRIDALISNDVHALQHTPLEVGEASDMRRACEALLVTPFALLAKAAAEMKRHGGGHIVLVTSAAPLRPEPGFSAYSAARAGASALARAAARELAPHGITVNAVAPNFLASETYYPAEVWGTAEGEKKLRGLLPAGRLGEAREIGALIAFLVSGQADFMTGEIINFTGGWA